MINEVWIQDGEPGVRRPPLYLERKQIYDERGRAVAGAFSPCAGGDGGCLDDILCGVTVRIAHLDPARGPGRDSGVHGWGIEGMWDALPAWRADADAFLNRDFDSSLWRALRGLVPPLRSGRHPLRRLPDRHQRDGELRLLPAVPGRSSLSAKGAAARCSPPTPPRAGDVANQAPVDARCAHFGLGDGQDEDAGGDAYEPYTAAAVADLDRRLPRLWRRLADSTRARACPAPPPPAAHTHRRQADEELVAVPVLLKRSARQQSVSRDCPETVRAAPTGPYRT